ncbi:hypothetical protein [Bosea robiniae]|jgi:hypothetical protein|uniref:Uncharacterized protein n=1 Tax=Bosea robiniae TaxID=1036780 RepID=A0ABY0NMV1_9HYPH|nr:hypothetical protein SAMN05421844_101937 [Bosea robiniae]
MHHLDPKTRNAADLALDCYKHCHGMAMTHCLKVAALMPSPTICT